jgi:outer membrane protein assembly factor BamB
MDKAACQAVVLEDLRRDESRLYVKDKVKIKMKNFLYAMLLGTVGLLAACSSENPALAPAPLPKFTSTIHPHSLWERKVGSGAGGYYLTLKPVIVEQQLFAASYDGVLDAINLGTGALVWRTQTEQHYSSGIFADNGLLFVATDDAHLLAIQQSNGQLVWSVLTSTQVLATPYVANGIVLVHAIDGTLTAYSEKDGHQLWQYKENVPDLVLHLSSEPQVVGSYVICGFASGKVAVLNLTNGQVIWEHQVAQAQGSTIVERMVDVDITPEVAVPGMVYVVDFQGNLQALNIENGNLIWEHHLSAYAGLTADQKALYVVDSQSHVWAFDQQTGAVLWQQEALALRGLTGPVVVGDALAVADAQGYVFWLSLSDGHFLGMTREALGSIAIAPLSDTQKRVYVYAKSGRLEAYKI